MKLKSSVGFALAGAGAGIVNGLFGAGGGMILVPLLGLLTDAEDNQIFHTSIAIILPICIISLVANANIATLPWLASLPYLIGSLIGGCFAAKYGNRFPAKWLHRSLGILIIWGGIRYLC